MSEASSDTPPSKLLTIVSWNVNGLASIVRNGAFERLFTPDPNRTPGDPATNPTPGDINQPYPVTCDGRVFKPPRDFDKFSQPYSGPMPRESTQPDTTPPSAYERLKDLTSQVSQHLSEVAPPSSSYTHPRPEPSAIVPPGPSHGDGKSFSTSSPEELTEAAEEVMKAAFLSADIICMQEHKMTEAKIKRGGHTNSAKDPLTIYDAELAKIVLDKAGWESFWSFCTVGKQAAYSGVVTFVRKGLTRAWSTLSEPTCPIADGEGRVVITDHGGFVLVNMYVPNTGRGGDDDAILGRRAAFQAAINARLDAWSTPPHSRGVVLIGDFNAVHSVNDIASGQVRLLKDKDTINGAGLRPFERAWITSLVGPPAGVEEPLGTSAAHQVQSILEGAGQGPCVDVWRTCVGDQQRKASERPRGYTWWSAREDGRANDVGWRLDYALISRDFAQHSVVAMDQMAQILGSDHCPVRLVLLRRVALGTDDLAGAWPTPSGGSTDIYTSGPPKNHSIKAMFFAAGKKSASTGTVTPSSSSASSASSVQTSPQATSKTGLKRSASSDSSSGPASGTLQAFWKKPKTN